MNVWLDRITLLAFLTLYLSSAAGAELNDRGTSPCANETQPGLPCPKAGYPGQSAGHGRNDDSDGHAGFSFTKLDAAGQPLPADAAAWTCVQDNVTGLTWEVKTDDGGLRDKDNTYTWYNPDAATGGEFAGYSGGGVCTGGIGCDTDSYVQAVNAAGLCGHTDWRLPAGEELRSLVDYGAAYPGSSIPTVDQRYFPHTLRSWCWSASPVAGFSGYAWYVDFGNGYSGAGHKSVAMGIRVVRGGPIP